MPATGAKPLSAPPLTVMSPTTKSWLASLRVKVKVAVSPLAKFCLSLLMAIVGSVVSTTSSLLVMSRLTLPAASVTLALRL